MLNDRSSILSLLETRRSGKPRELVGPGPTAEELERILAIAARTPDHGKLFPWRFVSIAEDQRDAFGALLREALADEDPDGPPARGQKEDEFAHYAGQLVVLISAPVDNHKIPLWEQQLSSGAAGMNLLLAAHALGFVAGWVTGWRA
jgi:nitroreductase